MTKHQEQGYTNSMNLELTHLIQSLIDQAKFLQSNPYQRQSCNDITTDSEDINHRSPLTCLGDWDDRITNDVVNDPNEIEAYRYTRKAIQIVNRATKFASKKQIQLGNRQSLSQYNWYCHKDD